MQSKPTNVPARRFFALTFLLSWLIWIPLDLSHFAIGPIRVADEVSGIVRLLGVLMPATAALILTGARIGRPGIGRLLRRLFIWRVGWGWWAAAVLVQPLLLLAAAGLHNVFGRSQAVTANPMGPMSGLIVNIVFLALATLGEEIGWRGVALPSLQSQGSALRASTILGLLWAAWHLPFWLLLDTYKEFGIWYLVLNFLLIMPTTFYITWFFNHSRGSLLLPVAFHLSFNIINVVLVPVTLNLAAFSIYIGFQWIVLLMLRNRLEPAAGRSEMAFAV